MGNLVTFVTPLHQATSRDYVARMQDQKVKCMRIAKRYDFDYWDGERRYGYGGYRYIPGRWVSVAESLIQQYELKPGSRVLDAGCGKGYLLYEMTRILPGLEVTGFDISKYALDNAKPEIQEKLFLGDLGKPFDYEDNSFDLVISVGCLHNLSLPYINTALSEIQRVSYQSYVMVESFRDEKEFFNLECWALTAETLLDVDSWQWLMGRAGYTGDFEFIFFE